MNKLKLATWQELLLLLGGLFVAGLVLNFVLSIAFFVVVGAGLVFGGVCIYRLIKAVGAAEERRRNRP